VNGDLNHEFMSRLGTWMSRAAAQIDSNLALINENEIFVRRTRGLGVLDAKTALKMGVTGPNLRASGVPYDLRRDRPYLVYPELEFDVPTRDEGDSLARYLVRMDEIKQSIRIIDQVLHEMPDGPVYGTYAISDGTDQPFRMRIHDPSFVHLQLVGPLTKGNLIADTMAVMASLDPVMGGVDK
jgi:NADH-quinone oxidoreductase subunit D